MSALIAGVSGIFGHDASVAILKDGICVGMIEEERIIREKRAVNAVPIKALELALREWASDNRDIEYVVPWSKKNIYSQDFLSRIEKTGLEVARTNLVYIDHHLAHAAYAISTSNLIDGAFLVVDGHSESKSITIGTFEKDQLHIKKEYGISASPGHFYEAVAFHLGFGYEGTGKLMGLASYSKGDPNEFGFLDLLHDGLKDEKGEDGCNYKAICKTTLEKWSEYLLKITPRVRYPDYSSIVNSDGGNVYMRVASSAQLAFEEIIGHLVQEAMGYSNTTNIVYSGGAALNCQGNARVEEKHNLSNLIVAPATGDSGTAIGAAMLASGRIARGQVNPYLGIDYEEHIYRIFLEECNIKYEICECVEDRIAGLIADCKVVGRFSGRAEIGPRALGNRSILARPDKPEVRDRVNRIKRREIWRPLAPALLERNFNKFFYREKQNLYMLKAVKIDSNTSEFMGTVHIDDTARAQVVKEELNVGFYKLLDALDGEGVRGVINTSFNDDREPIVHSVRDAVRTFYSTGIDCLLLGQKLLIEK